MSLYDADFYATETKIATQSAKVVLPWVFEKVQPFSVIDVGCGTGGWASVAKQLGANILGVDNGVPEDQLVIDEYLDWDLNDGYECHEFDLAICLEVAEHLPEEAAVPLVNGLACAEAVLFSAATPGQPGVGHVWCQPHDYWHDLFAPHGLLPTHIGPRFTHPVADFYQRNMMLYRRAQ